MKINHEINGRSNDWNIFQFCLVKHYVVWTESTDSDCIRKNIQLELKLKCNVTFDPLIKSQTTRSPWTILYVCPCPTGRPCYFCHLKQFLILTFFDLWHLNSRSDEEVTVDTFDCLSMSNRLTQLFLPFEIISSFDLWPLNGRSDDGVSVDTFTSLSM